MSVKAQSLDSYFTASLHLFHFSWNFTIRMKKDYDGSVFKMKIHFKIFISVIIRNVWNVCTSQSYVMLAMFTFYFLKTLYKHVTNRYLVLTFSYRYFYYNILQILQNNFCSTHARVHEYYLHTFRNRVSQKLRIRVENNR